MVGALEAEVALLVDGVIGEGAASPLDDALAGDLETDAVLEEINKEGAKVEVDEADGEEEDDDEDEAETADGKTEETDAAS